MSLNLQANLDQDQLNAVISGEQRLLCLANAGSGKTRMLTFRAAAFIDAGTPENAVMMLTFTKKAANEMQERIAKLLGKTHITAMAGTFHSIACRIIRQYPEYSGIPGSFNIFDTDTTKLWLQNAITNILNENTNLKLLKDRPTAANIQKEYSFCRNTGGDFAEHMRNIYDEDDKLNICLEAVNRYETIKRSTPAADFDDLLLIFAKMLRNPDFRQIMQNRFPAVFVDEYQDINVVQHEIIKNLVGPRSYLTAVGDNAQCIYGFRGSDIKFIETFCQDFENPCVLYLPKNYRSTPNIVNAAARTLNESIYHCGEEKIMIANRPNPGQTVNCVYLKDESKQAEYITNHCLAARANMNWSDMAILVRTKFDANLIEAVMLKAGIPVSKECGIEFYKKAQINIVVKYLQYLHVPNDKAAFAKFIGKCPKIGQKTIDKLFDAIANAGFDLNAAAKVKPPGNKQNALYDAILKSMSEAQAILKSGHSEPKLLAENFITDFIMPWCKLQYGESNEELCTRLLEVEELLDQLDIYPTLDSFLENALLDMTQEEKQSADRVRIMTIHKSKGLEFKKVFLPSMSQGLTPSNKQANDLKEMQEELRVVYVAMTRAMDELDIIAIEHCNRVQGGNEGPATLAPSEFFDNMTFRKVKI